MDRNQVIGIVLIALMLVGYFAYMDSQPKKQTQGTETTKVVQQQTTAKKDTVADSAEVEAFKKKLGSLAAAATGKEEDIVLENDDVKLILSTKGGAVKSALLKKYVTHSGAPLYLFNENNANVALLASTPSGEVDLNKVYYAPVQEKIGDTSVVKFRINLGENKFIEKQYALAKTGFEVKHALNFKGVDDIINNAPVKMQWKEQMPKLEYDLELSRNASTINYYTVEDGFDNLAESSKDEESIRLGKGVKWVSIKQKFFNTGIIAENQFEGADLTTSVNLADTITVKNATAEILFPVGDLKTGKGNFKFYFGPNHFQTLKDVTEGYGKNVTLGIPVINWINRFITIPTFNFLQKFIGNYGIIIIILAILVKVILLPLSYKSQLSMAKMKVLKPEIDEIKEKHGDDMQKVNTETMALYQKVGINPLSGCIPVLLSMPVLFAMFSFFPNSIELRQQSFLWAHDLSTYDAPIHLPFKIPFYGAHVSLFTLLMTISTLVYTYYNNQVSTVTGPMKSLSYIMPVIFLFVLNSFPAGLSFYYFVSNILSIGQQLLFKRMVDEDKIKLSLEENRKKIASGQGKKSKWMQRVEEAMKAREEMEKKKKK